MFPIDYVHELLLPEAAVAVIAALTLVLCVYVWVKCKEYASLGYILPSLYFVVTYIILFFHPEISSDWRRVLIRGGLVVLFANISFQRWKFIFICRDKERQEKKNEQRTSSRT